MRTVMGGDACKRAQTTLFSIFAALAAAFAFSGPALAAGPSITSDQADYAPGSTVTLTAAGWGAGESVHITVNDTIGQTWVYNTDVLADLSGGFESQIQLPNYFVSDYDVTATGSAGLQATTTFTDGNATGATLDIRKSDCTTSSTSFVVNDVVCARSVITSTTSGTGDIFVQWVNPSGGNVGAAIQHTGLPNAAFNDLFTATIAGTWTVKVCSNGSCPPNQVLVSKTFTVTGKQNQTITFNQPPTPAAYNSTFTVSASAAPSGLLVTITATGGCTINASNLVTMTSGTTACTLTASQAGNAQYTAATDVVRTVAGSRQNQTISFTSTAPSNAVVGDSYQPQATGGGSGNAVTFGVSGPCSWNGGTGLVTMTSVGTCTVTADQAGNANYNAAPQLPQSFGVAKGNQTIAVNTPAPANAAYNSSFTVAATATSGLPVSYSSAGSCSNVGATFTITSGTGTCTVTYDQPGNSNFNAAPQVTSSVTTSKVSQTISFGALGDKAFGDPAFAVSATGGGSGNPVTFTATGGNCTSGGTNGATIAITGAGTCTITADQAGDANYVAATSVPQTFQIAKAASTTSVSCPTTALTYNGSARTPCTASVTGAGGLNETLTVSHTDNTDAGTAHASASYAGDDNHTSSGDAQTFTIEKAESVTSVSCPTSTTYTGSAQTPCTANVTGAGGLNGTPTVSHTDNTNAGTAHASASFAGDDNHTGSNDSATFTIEKAGSLTSVSCPTTALTYNGSPRTPCTASVTGAGDLNETLPVTHADNTNAGTAHASASFAGDDNHTGSSDAQTFQIEKAESVTLVSCPTSTTYTGSAQTPCTANVTGAGGLNETLTTSHTDNTNAGTAHASASFAGDDNHTGSNDSATFTIEKAASLTSVSCPATPLIYNGSARTPCIASVTGAGGLNATLTVSHTDNTNAGTGHASASFAGDDNHTGSSDAQTFQIDKADASVAIDWTNSVYDGTANSASSTVTGPVSSDNPIILPPVILTYYTGPDTSGSELAGAPTDAGTYTVLASFAGNGNYNSDSTTKTISIAKAASTTSVSCPAAALTYNGSPRTPCTASVTGAGGLNETLTVSHTDNTNAGTAHASASFAGDANHNGSSDAQTFQIDKADASVAVTWADATYNGSAHPASASVTGPVSSDNPITVPAVSFTYYSGSTATGTDSPAAPTNSGTYTVVASFAGNGNYNSDSATKTISIAKAASTTSVSCPADALTYNGSPRTPCTASVTGAGGLNETLTVSHTDNTNAGTAHASASFAGDDNHTGSTDAQTFTIEKAASATSVTCPTSTTYTGSAQTPCTATAAGAGGLSQSLTVTHTDNTNAGTAHASASFAGDANHTGSNDAQTFTIEKAASLTSVSCPATALIYNGSARTPCTASVTGAGGLSQSLTVTHTDNTNAGTGHASASFAGDDNHTGSSDSRTFTIDKAVPTVTITWVEWVFDGVAHPATGSVGGVGSPSENLGAPTFVYYSGSIATGTPLAGAPSTVGTYTVLASFAGNGNYKPASATKAILVSYRWDGFLQPINDTAHQTGLAESKFKLGQTIPAKFVLKNAAGTIVQQSGSPTFSRSGNLGSCDLTAALDTADVVTPDAGVVYNWDGSQYHYNWSTKGLTAGEYRIYANLADGSKKFVDICLTK